MDEYEVIDVVGEKIPPFVLYPNTQRCVYIPKKIYDKHVSVGLMTRAQVRHQVDLDLPRSSVYLDGEKIVKFPDYIDYSLSRYCTQTVMGLPVQMLSQTGIVSELVSKNPREFPMSVSMWNNNVHVQKKLRILQENIWFPVEIKIYADMNDDCVLIKLHAGNVFNSHILLI